MKELVEKLKERLEKLRQWRRKGNWANPHNSNYSNGYDAAVDSEIEFLEELIKNYD